MFTSIVCMILMAEAPARSQSEVHVEEQSSPAAEHAFSCAHNALYLLLKLLDRPATLDDVKLQLHVGENGEASMAELQQAAAHFDVSLVGRWLSGKDVAKFDVPLIVLLQNPTTLHGHYLVSRWIDGRQTLQALDAPKETTGTLSITSRRPATDTKFLDDYAAGPESAEIAILVDPARAIEAHPKSLFANRPTDEKGLLIYIRATQPGFQLSARPPNLLPKWIRIEPAESPIEGMQSFRVRIAEPPPDPASSESAVTAEIRFETNHPAMPEIVVPVIYRRIEPAGG